VSIQHIEDSGRHIDELDRRLRGLKVTFADLRAEDDFDELINIIHRPGWTTLPDVLFVNALIDAAERSAENAQALRQTLLAGARLVGEFSFEPA
jgi:hypothetical protein